MSKSIQFKIQCNTDTVDIDNKCLGLSAWVPGDSVNLLNTNRGLHIQIRHNGDESTYEAAIQLSRLLSAAPEMLALLERAEEYFEGFQLQQDIRELINKAKGLI